MNFFFFFLEKKSHLGQFDLSRSFFDVWLDVATVTIGSLKSQDIIKILK